MDYYLLMDYWGTLVRDFKDNERQYERSLVQSENLARYILNYVRNTRFRQYNLFTQKRGEEYERLFALLDIEGHPRDAIDRFVDNEKLWETTLELANV